LVIPYYDRDGSRKNPIDGRRDRLVALDITVSVKEHI
jgi:hypothetical protein